MRVILLSVFILITVSGIGQRINQVPDTLRNPGKQDTEEKVVRKTQENGQQSLTADDVIKERLIKIALKNPALQIGDANIEIAKFNRKQAGASWLNSIALGGNINEFVINNSDRANFFPKYNAGISLPLGIFSRTKNEKKVADQNIIVAEAQKQQIEREIISRTLTLYEDFNEKSQLVTLQSISIENNLDAYKIAQKSFEDGTINIEELNRVYQNYMNEQNKLVTYKKNLSVSIIALEEILGMPLEKAAPGLINR